MSRHGDSKVNGDGAAKSAAASGQAFACSSITKIIGEVIEALLIERSKDGVISTEDARMVVHSVTVNAGILKPAFSAQELKCKKFFCGRTEDSGRENHFQRLMTRPIETLLVGDSPRYPRNFLTNYLSFVEAALGDKFKQYDSVTKEVFQALAVAHGQSLVWEMFFKDEKVQRILARALATIIASMETPAGQWAWTASMTEKVSKTGLVPPTSAQADAVRNALQTTLRGISNESR